MFLSTLGSSMRGVLLLRSPSSASLAPLSLRKRISVQHTRTAAYSGGGGPGGQGNNWGQEETIVPGRSNTIDLIEFRDVRRPNILQLVGNLGNDPDYRQLVTKAGETVDRTEFSIALYRPKKQGAGAGAGQAGASSAAEGPAEWVRCVAWRDLAVEASQKLRKGNQVRVTGTLKVDSYKDKRTEEMRTRTVINVESISLVNKRSFESPRTASDEARAGEGPEAGPSGRSLRVMTLNVWFGARRGADENVEQSKRFGAILNMIGSERPDVVCLQEVTGGFVEALRRAPWVRDYHDFSREPLGWYFPLLLVSKRLDLESPISEDPFDVSTMGRSLLWAAVRLPPSPLSPQGLTLALGTVHLESVSWAQGPGGRPAFVSNSDWRAEQLGVSLEALGSMADCALLAGDYNWDDQGDDGPIEQHFPRGQPAWNDVWSLLQPSDPGFTYDKQRNTNIETKKNFRLRIDRLLLKASPGFSPRKICMVGTTPISPDNLFLSDHFGLVADFEY